MSSDIGWLLIGAFGFVILAFVIRVRIKLHQPFEPKPESWWKQWMRGCVCWITPRLPSLGWIMIGFMFGSLVVLWLEKFGLWIPNLPPFTFPSHRG